MDLSQFQHVSFQAPGPGIGVDHWNIPQIGSTLNGYGNTLPLSGDVPQLGVFQSVHDNAVVPELRSYPRVTVSALIRALGHQKKILKTELGRGNLLFVYNNPSKVKLDGRFQQYRSLSMVNWHMKTQVGRRECKTNYGRDIVEKWTPVGYQLGEVSDSDIDAAHQVNVALEFAFRSRIPNIWLWKNQRVSVTNKLWLVLVKRDFVAEIDRLMPKDEDGNNNKRKPFHSLEDFEEKIDKAHSKDPFYYDKKKKLKSVVDAAPDPVYEEDFEENEIFRSLYDEANRSGDGLSKVVDSVATIKYRQFDTDPNDFRLGDTTTYWRWEPYVTTDKEPPLHMISGPHLDGWVGAVHYVGEVTQVYGDCNQFQDGTYNQMIERAIFPTFYTKDYLDDMNKLPEVEVQLKV